MSNVDDRQKFEKYCEENQIAPEETFWKIWKAALATQYEQIPLCYGLFDRSGLLVQLVDTYIPNNVSNITPLYSRPQNSYSVKPDLTKEQIEYIWSRYYAEDGDLIGMVKWVERYSKDFKK